MITRLPGAAPEEVETEITDKIEEAVNTISGIDELRSISSEGVSQVYVTFSSTRTSTSPRRRCATTSAACSRIFPKDIDPPVVAKMDPDAAPVLYVSVNADKPIREVTEVADKRDPPADREHPRRRSSAAPRRRQATNQRLARSAQAARCRPHRRRSAARDRRFRTSPRPVAASTPAPSS